MTRQMVSALLGAIGIAIVASCAALDGDDENKDDDDDTGGAAGTSVVVGGSGGSTAGRGGTNNAGSGAEDTGGGGSSATECEDLAGLPADCGATTSEAQKIEVNMLLVMDKSGSMNGQPTGYDVTLWEGLKTALGEALGDPDVQTSMSLGLLLYPDKDVALECSGAEACCQVDTAAGVDVPIGFGADTVPQMLALLDETNPGGGTPIAKALTKAFDYFDTGAGSQLGGDRYVLLATDGGPNCNADIECTALTCTRNLEGTCNSEPDSCCDTQPTACVDDLAVIAEIERLDGIGVQTFVVGIPGSEAYASYLDSFAVAGGRALSGGARRYYEVAASGGVEALTDTFKAITIDLVQSCDIELENVPSDTDQVNVAVDCSIITRGADDEDGSSWSFSDDYMTIFIDGAACDRIKTTGARRIDAIFGCGTIY